jgi:hypothetical protein
LVFIFHFFIEFIDTNVSDHPNNTSRAESVGKSKINRRKMKMFSRMSAEAQTALTETIMENNLLHKVRYSSLSLGMSGSLV